MSESDMTSETHTPSLSRLYASALILKLRNGRGIPVVGQCGSSDATVVLPAAVNIQRHTRC